MWRSVPVLVVVAAVLALQIPTQAWGKEALAFVTEVNGEAQIARGSGAGEKAAVGSQLFDGDAVEVSDGNAVLIYLSGRSVEVGTGSRHAVQGGAAESSELMGRVMNTIAEIAGPQSEADRPVVHGMARDLAGLHGALPANTRILDPDFTFSWDALEDVEEYEIALEDTAGNVVATRTVTSTSIRARQLPLQSGKRFVWYVQETGSFLPRSSGRSWFEIAGKTESEKIGETLTDIDKLAAGESKATLKAISLYKEGYYYESERMLKDAEAKRPLTELESKLLNLVYVKMERWSRLPEPPAEEEAGEPKTTDQ